MLEYLKLSRAHTAPLEAVPALLGAALATGTVWREGVAWWLIAGLLYHLAGYSHNSFEDWRNGFDKNDPHKQHHPLNRGTISVKRAEYFTNLLLIITVLYVLSLAYPDPQALGVLTIGLATGFAYNRWGKATKFKFLLISAAHTSMFILPYLSLGGDPTNLVFILATMYVFLWIIFQISVSGEIKDIRQDESNFLKDLGTCVTPSKVMSDEDIIEFSIYVRHYAHSIKMLSLFTAFTIAAALDSIIIVYILISLGALLIINTTTNMIMDGPWNRATRVTQMSIIEMLSAIVFVVSLWSVIGPAAVGVITASSIFWALVGNKILWGTLVGPKV